MKPPRTDHDKSSSHRINEMSRTMGKIGPYKRHVIVGILGHLGQNVIKTIIKTFREKKILVFSEIKNQNVFRLISSNIRSKKTMERYL